MKKSILSLLCVVLLLSVLPLSAWAHQVPDVNRTGSISVTMTHDKKPVSGGTLTIYRVADVVESDGNYSFAYTPTFSGCTADLADPAAPAVAEKLADFVKKHSLAGTTKTIGTDGKVTFTGLKTGLYILIQKTPASGFNAVKPFVIGIPNNDNGNYVYDVDASPKIALETAPTKPSTETTIPDETIPQTGQTNWPVPVLLVTGLLFVAGGWYMRKSGKETVE